MSSVPISSSSSTSRMREPFTTLDARRGLPAPKLVAYREKDLAACPHPPVQRPKGELRHLLVLNHDDGRPAHPRHHHRDRNRHLQSRPSTSSPAGPPRPDTLPAGPACHQPPADHRHHH